MTDPIRKIYKGYRDLINCLEEKFPGGVHGTYGAQEALLTITPATQVMRDALIVPACEKFNELGSTKLNAYVHEHGVTVGTTALAPTLHTLYGVIGEVIAPGLPQTFFDSRGSSEKIRRCLPPELQEIVKLERGVGLLHAWLVALINDYIATPNLVRIRGALRLYTIAGHHPGEAINMATWITQEDVKNSKHALTRKALPDGH